MAENIQVGDTGSGTRTVVVAIDDSEYAEYAFDFYLDNIKRESDNIVLVHVPEYHNIIQFPMLFSDPNIVSEIIKDEDRKTKALLRKYTQKLHKAGLGGKLREMTGKIGETIMEAAHEEKANLIVVGTRGLSKIRRTVIGSVSDYLLHHAHVPVLVCRK